VETGGPPRRLPHSMKISGHRRRRRR